MAMSGGSTPAPASTASTPAATQQPPAAPAAPSTPAATPAEPAAAASPAAAPSVVPAVAPKPAAPQVPVSLSGGYPFAVLDGGRELSAASTSHQLKVGAGRSLVLSAPKYFLRQTVRVEGSSSQGFDWEAPGLGKLDVRSPQETCEVMIGDRKLGNPPLVIQEIAAGQYKVDISCAGEVVKSHYATVRPGQTYVAAIR